MNTTKRTTLLIASTIATLACTLLAVAQVGGVFDLTRGTIETSGSASSSGQYVLDSAVHQPIAELTTPSAGGPYVLTSGFLAFEARQDPEPISDLWSIR